MPRLVRPVLLGLCWLAGSEFLLASSAQAVQVAQAAPVAPVAQEVPSFAAVRAAWQPSDWLLTDRNGIVMQRVRRDMHVRRLDWVSLDALSPTVEATLLAAEDKRFYEHGGVDWLAVAGAALDRLTSDDGGKRGNRSDGDNRHNRRNGHIERGASTLTMQLAALLDPALRPAPKQRRDWQQKWDQAGAAWRIERQWSKAQILEAYMNLVPLRGETVGIAAASEFWFGKSPDGLDLAEAALLTALIRQPQASPSRAGERACAIVAGLPSGALPGVARPDCAVLRARALATLTSPMGGRLRDQMAPHVARRALAEVNAATSVATSSASINGHEARLRTTLDARLQAFSRERLMQHLRELAGRNVEDGALLVLDNATGAVLAWVGSSGEMSDAAQVDGVTALRQAGSTLKPFLYGLAIERRLLTAASLVDDSPLALTAENGAYIPQNYDRHFQGIVSVRTALASSLNIPAVRTLLLTGTDTFYDGLRRAGFATLTEPADYYGLSLALGGAEVRLLDLANAYRALANDGRWSPVAPLLADSAVPVGQGRRLFSPATAFIVGDILADRGARAPTFGFENALATRVWAAVKTGTSKDMRDNWAVGYTSRYTVAVWVGNFSGKPMWNVSGMHGAAPLWRDVVHFLHESAADPAPRAPAGIERVRVEFADIAEASRLEWFLPGTAMTRVVLAAHGSQATVQQAESETSADQNVTASFASVSPTILYPADGLIVALDPDIPQALERIPLRLRSAGGDYFWTLERQSGAPCVQTIAVPAAGAPAEWAPAPGLWRVVLHDAGSRAVVAESRIQVRGSARHAVLCEADEDAPAVSAVVQSSARVVEPVSDSSNDRR